MNETKGGRYCVNCGEFIPSNKSGHFVPPCLGEMGFYICDAAKRLNKEKENQADGSKH